jgi:uncharacterized protein
MSKVSTHVFTRAYGSALVSRLTEPRRFLQVILGPRQVGKTTLVRQVIERAGQPAHVVSADEPTLRQLEWLAQQWDIARDLARSHEHGAVLVLDEVQKVANWPETVKRLWDEDSARRVSLRVILLGSAPLAVQQGLTESLAGRFEVVHLPHWSWPEMREAFGFSFDHFLFYGGYPGAAPLTDNPPRWAHYVKDSLIEMTLSRDVLLLTRVDKPALLRQLFELGCQYSSQILSYNKMLGQLQDAGNATTLAHYLDLLSAGGMLTGLQKYAGSAVRQRGSSPKLQVMNTALMTALSGLTLEESRADRARWGRLVESAVGAHLANAATSGAFQLYYWRERGFEVDFVLKAGRSLVAIEVKSGQRRDARPGMDAFVKAFRPTRSLLVGTGGVAVEDFLSSPVERWLTP